MQLINHSSLSDDDQLTMELMDGFEDDFVPEERIIDTPNRQFWDSMQQKADYVTSMNNIFEAEKHALQQRHPQNEPYAQAQSTQPTRAQAQQPYTLPLQRVSYNNAYNNFTPRLASVNEIQTPMSTVGLTRLRILSDQLDPLSYKEIMSLPPLERMKRVFEITKGKNPLHNAKTLSEKMKEENIPTDLSQINSIPLKNPSAAPDSENQFSSLSQPPSLSSKSRAPSVSRVGVSSASAPTESTDSKSSVHVPKERVIDANEGQYSKDGTNHTGKESAHNHTREIAHHSDMSMRSSSSQNEQTGESSEDLPPLQLPAAQAAMKGQFGGDGTTHDTHRFPSEEIHKPPVTAQEHIAYLVKKYSSTIKFPDAISEKDKLNYAQRYFESSSAIYNSYSEKFRGNAAYQRQNKAAQLRHAKSRINYLPSVKSDGKSDFETKLINRAIVSIQLDSKEDFVPFDASKHDLERSKWHKLILDPQRAFRHVYDTKDSFKDMRNADAEMRVQILFRKMGKQKAQEILNKNEPNRTEEIIELTSKHHFKENKVNVEGIETNHTLENTPVRLNFPNLKYGHARYNWRSKLYDEKQDSMRPRSSLIVVQSVSGKSNRYKSFWKKGTEQAHIITPMGKGITKSEPLNESELLQWAKSLTQHGGDDDGGIPEIKDENGVVIQKKLDFKEAMQSFYTVMNYNREVLYHELNHASAETAEARRFNEKETLTKMPGLFKSQYVASINETLNSLKSLTEFAYSELGLDIRSGDDILEFHELFWVHAGEDHLGNKNKAKIPLNARRLMVALDQVKEYAIIQEKTMRNIVNEYCARPNVRNDRSLLIKSEYLASQIRKMILKHKEYEKTGMESRVKKEYEALTEDEKSLYKNIRAEKYLLTPDLRPIFIKTIDDEALMEQVQLTPDEDTSYNRIV